MKTKLLVMALCLTSSMLYVGCFPGPDSCEALGAIPTPVSCRVIRADGGAAAGLQARCTLIDAGAVTDSDGGFSFTANETPCGIAVHTFDCGQVQLIDDGGVVDMSFGPGDGGPQRQLSPGMLSGGACLIAVP